MFTARQARASDVVRIRDLFVGVYGEGYPFKGFYDTDWITRLIYDDGTRIFVGELDGEVLMTASVNLSVGGMEDMMGEGGRLVAAPDERVRGRDYALTLCRELYLATADRLTVAEAAGGRVLSCAPVVRRLLLALCAVVLMQETNLGSLLVGAACFESCPDDTTPGHCPPTCATCGCGSHLSPVTPRPVRVASPASSECRPTCVASLPPADSHLPDILHVPKSLLA